MSVFTVSINFLENIKQGELGYFASILYQFANPQNPAKIAIDKERTMLSRYRAINNHADQIKSWLDILSYVPSSTEIVNVDLKQIADSEELCYALCSKVNGAKQVIVHSLSSLRTPLSETNDIDYGATRLHIIDKDEAQILLNTSVATNIVNSVLVGGDANKIDNRNNSNQ